MDEISCTTDLKGVVYTYIDQPMVGLPSLKGLLYPLVYEIYIHVNSAEIYIFK